ncbi:MAG: Lrp/AsnC family transcriptional regulator [Kangiellaceae bacterium]|nr:Lrp/AsnC family transcriptional regulator [Kangiellaceae bacterium]MCW8997347.1 Lrp/AsnC family transcriptional regulator [Kangiellaceae bacterium]
MPNSTISALDWNLIQLLQKDSRTTISELAKSLNRSRSTIAERVERLVEKGMIQNFSAKVDPEKLGFGLKAFVRLSAGSKNHRQIIDAISKLPELVECHVLTGSELLILQVIAKDMAHLRSLVDSLTTYGSTQTDVVFATIKDGLVVDEKLKKVNESTF